MSMRTLEAVIAQILEDEGGIGDVGDGKGLTRFGQTSGWLEDHDFIPPRTVEQAYRNYEAWLTQKTKLGLLIEISPYIGYLIADWAVLSGVKPAVKGLQRELGVDDDGIIGPVTLNALRTADPAALSRGVLAAHEVFIGDLLAAETDAKGNPIDRRQFAKSWTRRHARQIRRLP